MEKAVFGASGFFSQEAFSSGFRGIEEVQIKHLKGTDLEVVEIWYNPWKVSYPQLLELFFDLHDPAAAFGQSYIYFTNKYQYEAAKRKKRELEETLCERLITKIAPLSQLPAAEKRIS